MFVIRKLDKLAKHQKDGKKRKKKGKRRREDSSSTDEDESGSTFNVNCTGQVNHVYCKINVIPSAVPV